MRRTDTTAKAFARVHAAGRALGRSVLATRAGDLALWVVDRVALTLWRLERWQRRYRRRGLRGRS